MNILLDKLDFNEEWAYETFKEIITPDKRICVLPLAFNEDWITNQEDWHKAYNNVNGEYYSKTVSVFYDFGISDSNISFVNYYEDDQDKSIQKIKNSGIILLTGGFPEKIKERLDELKLTDILESYKGVVIGWSAGAMVQCRDYFISPDEDYPSFQYKKGLDFITDFAIEVHYEEKESQVYSIEKYINERDKKVYIMREKSAIIKDQGNIKLLGNAQEYLRSN